MQNASTANHPPPPGQQNWSAAPPNVYPGHQRQPSNPRPYDQERREEQQPVYDQQYGYQQGFVGNYNYNSVYTTPASGSRRTSGPKTTPPSATSPATFAPPRPEPQYQPSSAPPQITTHHSSMNQPQTAHPYGGYYNYYDQSQQWHQYPQYQQARPPQQTTTPTMPQNPVIGEPQRSASFEYPQTSPGYQQSFNPERQWQPPPRQGSLGNTAMPNWQQGYPHMAQVQTAPGYPQYQQYPGYGYPPISQPPPTAQIVNPGKKGKKDIQHGKRPNESSTEDENDDKKSKKKKKEEKPIPKLPAKSQLRPPRQAQSAWQLFFTDELNKAKAAAQQGNSPGGTPHHSKLNVAQIAKDAGAAYATLNDEQKAYYAQKVQESKDQYAIELAAWQKTLTPEDIRAENAFRAQQRKEGKSRKGNLKDPNAPKKPLSAYFLFLKSIREDDDLRARVWAEESETTKQSVLAAERWRGLTDVEKRPYLAQAEKDKQDYEVARKVYEEEAAARARGEDVPHREHVFEATSAHINPPTSLRKKSTEETPAAADFETPLDLDEFHGFQDPLEGMDLAGLEGIATDNHAGQWDELQQLMGDDKKVSEAPALSDIEEKPVVTDTKTVEQVAAAAEGEMSVPDIKPTVPDVSTVSLQDTEATNEADIFPFDETTAFDAEVVEPTVPDSVATDSTGGSGGSSEA